MSEKIHIKKRKGEKINLFGTGEGTLSALKKGTNITIYDNCEAVVDGCYGIIEYGEHTVKLSLGKTVVKIEGCDLSISNYTEKFITVKGIIKSIEYC
ncbi:MAG: YabP/YqfC family sporulation protein [Clostridia bacterium]|nr:YabP/YqfC family sporulation protein [Clostridia bacterium]